MKALLAHPGTQYSFRLARQLQKHDSLGRFWTGMAYRQDSLLGNCIRYLPAGVERALANRRLDGVRADKLRTRPLVEWQAMRRLRAGEDDQTVMFDRNAAFQRGIPDGELTNCDVIIGFDTSSWLLAERATAIGRPLLVDQSIGHPLSYRRLFPVLQKRFPEWVEEFAPRPPALLRAEEVEHGKACRIVAASSFTRQTLIENGVPAEKIVVNPYGVDLERFTPRFRPDPSRPLRFAFVGLAGARKGVPLMLDAWRRLAPEEAELWVIGPIEERQRRLVPQLRGLQLVGKVPHRDLPNMLAQCDVLVFPSFFEGFGLVLLEAMAAGMPIIATDATAAPDLITHGVEGFVIPSGDSDALIDSTRRFIESPDRLERMSAAARRCAERYSWDAYGDRWREILRQVA